MHSQRVKLNAFYYVEGDDENDENDDSTKRKNYILIYSRSRKIEKQDSEKGTNDLQIFPPADVNGPSEITDDLEQQLAATKANTDMLYIEKRELKSIIKRVTLRSRGRVKLVKVLSDTTQQNV